MENIAILLKPSLFSSNKRLEEKNVHFSPKLEILLPSRISCEILKVKRKKYSPVRNGVQSSMVTKSMPLNLRLDLAIHNF